MHYHDGGERTDSAALEGRRDAERDADARVTEIYREIVEGELRRHAEQVQRDESELGERQRLFLPRNDGGGVELLTGRGRLEVCDMNRRGQIDVMFSLLSGDREENWPCVGIIFPSKDSGYDKEWKATLEDLRELASTLQKCGADDEATGAASS